MKYFLIIAAVVLLLACLIVGIRQIIFALTEKRIASYQNDLIQKHCEEVENMYRQVRGWRHDYKHHIQTMKAHLIMGQYEELNSYLNELDTDLTTVDTVIKTGNVKIDAVLNSKLAVAKARGIQVNAKAIVPQELPVSEVDLCIIIGNLLDNAMEACAKEPEEEKRFIRVYMDILKGQLYLYVANSMTNDIRRQGNHYLTTKKGGHGFGLMRVDKVVSHYNGYLNRQHEDGVFATEIMLALPG